MILIAKISVAKTLREKDLSSRKAKRRASGLMSGKAANKGSYTIEKRRSKWYTTSPIQQI